MSVCFLGAADAQHAVKTAAHSLLFCRSCVCQSKHLLCSLYFFFFFFSSSQGPTELHGVAICYEHGCGAEQSLQGHQESLPHGTVHCQEPLRMRNNQNIHPSIF